MKNLRRYRGSRRQRTADRGAERRFRRAASSMKTDNPSFSRRLKWTMAVAAGAFLLTWICMPIYERAKDEAATLEAEEAARKTTLPIYNLKLGHYVLARDVFSQIAQIFDTDESNDEAKLKEEILQNDITVHFLDEELVELLIQNRNMFRGIRDHTLDIYENILGKGVAIGGYGPGSLLGKLDEYFDPEFFKDGDSTEAQSIHVVRSDNRKKHVFKVVDIPDTSAAIEAAGTAIDDLKIERLNPDVRALMKKILGKMILSGSGNLDFDLAATLAEQDKNAAAVPPVYSAKKVNASSVFFGVYLLMAFILGAAVLYCAEIRVGSGPSAREWTAFIICAFAAIAALRVGTWILDSPTLDIGQWVEFPALLLPVGTAAGLTTILLGPAYGILATLALSILAGIMSSVSHESSLPQLLTLLASGFASTFAMLNVRRRKDLVTVSVYTTGAVVLVSIAAAALQSNIASWLTLQVGATALVAGLLSAAFIPLALPGLEFIAGSATDLELMDLSDLNNPLLERLQKMAPGTFNHSLNVARLVEAAAETLHENALLGRVGAYFHDIGKMSSANYFIENQKGGPNLHDQLKPTMSARILIAHVKEGVELGRDNRLPKAGFGLDHAAPWNVAHTQFFPQGAADGRNG